MELELGLGFWRVGVRYRVWAVIGVGVKISIRVRRVGVEGELRLGLGWGLELGLGFRLDLGLGLRLE